MVGTVAFTFDVYQSVMEAFEIMAPRGLVGTFFADPGLINQPGQATTADLILLKQSGWEIGIYLQGTPDMDAMQVNNRNLAYEKIVASDGAMNALGFKISSVAPNSRKWNARLVDMVRGRWKCVRANKDAVNLQSYPIANPLWIEQGGAAAWAPSDTSQGLRDHINRVVGTNQMVAEVIHRLGPNPDGLYVNVQPFTDAMDHAAYLVTTGQIRVCTMEQALAPPGA